MDILIDGGESRYGSTLVDYLESRSVDDIEIIVATYPHSDHIGGLPAVVEAYEVEIESTPG